MLENVFMSCHLKCQIKYMNVLVARGLVHELHLWDFSTRRSKKNQNKEDIATMLKIKVCYLISRTYQAVCRINLSANRFQAKIS